MSADPFYEDRGCSENIKLNSAWHMFTLRNLQDNACMYVG